MKNHFKFLVALVMMTVAVSCDELFPGGGTGDAGDNGDGGSGSVVNPLPYVEPEDRIVAREEYGNIEYYEYDQQGRLVKITCCRNDRYSEAEDVSVETTTFSYEGLLVKSKNSEVIYSKIGEYDPLAQIVGKDTYICKGEDFANIRWTEGVLGASGRLTAVSHYRNEHDWFHDEYTRYLSWVETYTHDAEGNLIGIVENGFNADGSQDGSPDSYLYSWKDDNVEYVDFEGDGKYTFFYLDKEYDWPGVNIYYDLDATDMYGDVDITGLDGRKWANLLDKVSAVNPETNREVYMEMVYTYDAKGRVKAINYKWCDDEGEEYFDESDAVKFYYGDETLPEPPVSVPVYLEKQEYVSHQMGLHKLSDGSGYLGEAECFDINIKIRNVFSDGSTTEYTQVNFGDVYVGYDGFYSSQEITRAELDELRSYSGANLSVLYGQNEYGENSLMAVSNYPVVGDITVSVVLRRDNETYLDPQEYSVYDPSQGGMTTHKLDIFTPDYLRSIMNVSWTLSKVDSWSDESWELWRLEQTITWNLWPGLQGIQDESRTVSVELYVPRE